jgi:isoleucyl-tRNA synthetase
LQDHILSELNVKMLRFVGPEEELVTYELKPRFKLLGPKYGRQVKAIAAALSKSDAQSGARLVAMGEPISVVADGQQIELLPEEVDVQARERADYSVATEEGYLVALRTEITAALELEGLARELIHHVQNLRRAANFDLSDRIVTYVGVTDGQARQANIAAMLRAHSATVAQETLSISVESSAVPDESHQEAVDLNGIAVTLGVALAT